MRAALAATLISRAMASASASGAERNVLGGPLALCSVDPLTGWRRDGFCSFSGGDGGVHVVAAVVSREFLDFTRSRGNDLETPRGSSFPGLKPGDSWCLCAMRWREAFEAGKAPGVRLAATSEAALRYVSLEALKSKAVDEPSSADADPPSTGPMLSAS